MKQKLTTHKILVPKVAPYFPDSKYFSYSYGEITIKSVKCSNKLVPMFLEGGSSPEEHIIIYGVIPIYIDLENGNIVSEYIPGGEAFLFSNLFEVAQEFGINIDVDTMIYYVEALSLGEISLMELCNGVAEEYAPKSLLVKKLFGEGSSQAEGIYDKIKAAFSCAKCLIEFAQKNNWKVHYPKEAVMVGHTVIIKNRNIPILKMMAYFRARNRDYQMLYSRNKSEYYATFFNKNHLFRFKNKSLLARWLRQFTNMSGKELESICVEAGMDKVTQSSSFAYDIEKMSKVIQNWV